MTNLERREPGVTENRVRLLYFSPWLMINRARLCVRQILYERASAPYI